MAHFSEVFLNPFKAVLFWEFKLSNYNVFLWDLKTISSIGKGFRFFSTAIRVLKKKKVREK
jgi:hypothetical protein